MHLLECASTTLLNSAHWLSAPATPNATKTHLWDSGKSRALQLWGVQERYHRIRTCRAASSLLGQHLWNSSSKQGHNSPYIRWSMSHGLEGVAREQSREGMWRAEQGVPV